MRWRFHVLLAFVAYVNVRGAHGATDLTRQPNAYGPEVVEAVVNIIRESCLFADDRRFLRRLAYVESQDGTAPRTFQSGNYGGIWQVDEREFNETLHQPSLANKYQIIRNVMGIDWPSVTWQELRKPLYSGIAAALFTILKTGSTGVSWKSEEQGIFWSNNFHGGRPANNFTELANILDLGCRTNQQVDLVFVLDTSSSLSADDFTRSILFISQVVDGFDIAPNQTQVGVVTFSSGARVEFYLNSYSYKSSLKNAINGIRYVGGSTQTDVGINRALQQVFATVNGARPYAVKVMVVITDGQSDDSINTLHAAERAHAAGIVTFSVGVGHSIGVTELNNIATDPDCTHAYTVNTYEEIKFMKEEIQKATCIAPLFINQTYSCKLSECPPLAVITGPNGTTLETNITCGNMMVYHAVNNPYPSAAQHEVAVQTQQGSVTQHYFNYAGKTLYINMKDPTTAYSNCIATITPYTGDKTDHTIYYRCFRDGGEIPCPDLNCTEKWNFPNPCTSANLAAGLTKFPHPYQSNKFLMCDLSGKLYVVICPQGELFNADCSQCLGTGTLVSSNCNVPLPAAIGNPCTRENILAGKMFFEYPGDHHKFIHCDVWGKPWAQDCPPGQLWDQGLETCYQPSTYEPCLHHQPGQPYLYPHYCDPHQYIHCDENHQSFIQSCQLDYVFLASSQTCVIPGTYDTGNLVNTCNGATVPVVYTTTQRHYVSGGTASSGYYMP
ncbi:uncharacterized protein LOC127840958 isoform X2 [Dreissena polymorpha]|uniref:Uncharacterized protein n=1 Tax=Dreissena polymorpha TaxID=45954 RepID=A0A9D4ERL0_DREPO|nr:uncharacterized protein LOC127840958 isoform X2 [Dreissena polymorpha]KAH3785095.1 hypothetical protein DPMN_163179 [Dreissena polymorpha]